MFNECLEKGGSSPSRNWLHPSLDSGLALGSGLEQLLTLSSSGQTEARSSIHAIW